MHPTSLLNYRIPEGRPRAIPPCTDEAPQAKVETAPAADGRPVREPGETVSQYGSRVGRWLESRYPAKKAARVAKMKETIRKNYIHRKRTEAAATVTETATERWYTYAEIAKITGLSRWVIGEYVRANKWPLKRVKRVGRGGVPVAVFGDPATMPGKRDHVAPEPEPVLILAPPVAELIPPPRPSLWQRIVRWFA